MKEHSEKILTFEQLILKELFQEWDEEEKQKFVDKKDWLKSENINYRRAGQGKDSQSTKFKWVMSWKMLNDPLVRTMTSDRFL